MNSLAALTAGSLDTAPTLPSSLAKPPATVAAATSTDLRQADVAKAKEVKEAFTSFVGETFYSHMLKSMRSTVGKPAYFHGGQAEEVFRSQLDQQLSQELSKSTGERFAEPMFEQQFPEQARLLREAKQQQSPLAELEGLRRK